MNDVIFTQENHIGIVTLNRIKALNALTLPMILALQAQLQSWSTDNNIHAVVVRAVAGKAFCAGGDVRWLYETGQSDDPQQMQFFWHEYRLNYFIHHFPKPYIALMDGLTMGGGVGISLHGSHPVATDRFMFAMPETSIGFFPDIGACYLLSRCPDHFGTYVGLTGARLGAEDALTLGLVKQVVASNQLDQIINNLVTENLSEDAFARVTACLSCFGLPASTPAIMKLQHPISLSFGQSNLAAILNALEEGKDDWHHKTLHTMRSQSPLSLAVTLAQIQKAKLMSVADCLKMDFCLVNHFMRDHDFYEGVRALLIDKDKSPQWQLQTPAELTDAKVSSYFKCTENELEFI